MLTRLRKLMLTGLVAVALPLSAPGADEPKTVPSGTEVKVEVKALEPAAPPVTLTLGSRHAQVTPCKHGFARTAGGNIDVAQPSADTVVITVTGLVLAGAHPTCDSDAFIHFDLSQCLEIVFDKPEVKKAKISIEGRMLGLLRSHCKGSASVCDLNASISAGGVCILALGLPGQSVACGENVSINNTAGPLTAVVGAGKYTLNETFEMSAHHPRCSAPLKAASAEFAPDPALNPVWIAYKEPFHGAIKNNLGLQITIKVVDATETDSPTKENGAAPPTKENGEPPPAKENGAEKVPPPMPK